MQINASYLLTYYRCQRQYSSIRQGHLGVTIDSTLILPGNV